MQYSEAKLKKLHNLLHEIKDGNSVAFEEMVELINPNIIAVCFGYLKNQQDAEDATQNTYISVVKNIASLNEKDNAFAWIYVIARNKCLDIIRHRMRHARSELTESVMDKFLVAEYEDEMIIKMLVNDLNSEDREFIILRYWGNLSYDEIAKITRKSRNKIRRRVEKILQRFKGME